MNVYSVFLSNGPDDFEERAAPIQAFTAADAVEIECEHRARQPGGEWLSSESSEVWARVERPDGPALKFRVRAYKNIWFNAEHVEK